MFRAFMFIFHVQVSPVGQSIITYVTYVVNAVAVTGYRAVDSAHKYKYKGKNIAADGYAVRGECVWAICVCIFYIGDEGQLRYSYLWNQ